MNNKRRKNMKKVLLYLSLGVVLFAQQPDYATLANQMYEKMKKIALPKSKEMLPKLEKVRECLSKANTKEEAKACSADMISEPTLDEKKMLDAYGISPEDLKAEKRKYAKDAKNFEWNEKIKQDTIKQLDENIIKAKATVKCFEKNNDFRGFNLCIKKAGIK